MSKPGGVRGIFYALAIIPTALHALDTLIETLDAMGDASNAEEARTAAGTLRLIEIRLKTKAEQPQ
jgi:hypothetical protein